jgi:hypothetical protein
MIRGSSLDRGWEFFSSPPLPDRTDRLERELHMVQLSATSCSYIAILSASLVSFAAINLCIAAQRVFFVVVYFVMTQSGDFWIYPRLRRRSSEAS